MSRKRRKVRNVLFINNKEVFIKVDFCLNLPRESYATDEEYEEYFKSRIEFRRFEFGFFCFEQKVHIDTEGVPCDEAELRSHFPDISPEWATRVEYITYLFLSPCDGYCREKRRAEVEVCVERHGVTHELLSRVANGEEVEPIPIGAGW